MNAFSIIILVALILVFVLELVANRLNVKAYGLLRLPFRIYGAFVIEERFGFNKTNPRTFFSDGSGQSSKSDAFLTGLARELGERRSSPEERQAVEIEVYHSELSVF